MLELVRHPDSPAGVVRRVTAEARRTPESGLALSYSLHGEVPRVRIPAPRPPRIGHRLWRHTCCEAFIAPAGEAGYHEFNFSPSAEWAAHAFTKYREGGVLDDESLDPQIAVRAAPDRLDLSALVDLPRLGVAGKILLALAVVIEQEDGALSYWALRHPPGKPDFHQRDSFTLELA